MYAGRDASLSLVQVGMDLHLVPACAAVTAVQEIHAADPSLAITQGKTAQPYMRPSLLALACSLQA